MKIGDHGGAWPFRRSSMRYGRTGSNPTDPQVLERLVGLLGVPMNRLNVSRQTVNAIEIERYEPSLSLAFTIAKLFEQPIEAIFRPNRR